MPTLIFDCDGVLADTEQDGHLRAFNETFAFFDLPTRWTVADYAEMVLIGGGKERLKSLLTPNFVSEAGLPLDIAGQSDTIAAWHRKKTEIYRRLVADAVMPPRPGIARIVHAASTAGWNLACASTSAESSVRAVLTHAVGTDLASQFSVFAGDIVAAKKPSPDIYRLAIDELGVDADDVIVIEDSNNGLRAAVGAGLRTVITVSTFTKNENFCDASLVVSSLGDPAPGETARIIADPLHIGPGAIVSLIDLSRILALPRFRHETHVHFNRKVAS